MNGRIALIAVVVLATLTQASNAASSHVTVAMKAVGGSGQNGTAKINHTSSGHITVHVQLQGERSGASEPVMIHAGSCSNLGRGSKAVLNPVIGGESITTFTPPAYGPGTHSIVVHKGVGKEMETIVSCGDVDIL